MAKKKTKKTKNSLHGASDQGGVSLVGMARTVGSTVGTAAAKAEDAANELGTFSQAVGKSTLATTRKLFKRAKKSLLARAASWKAGTKKRKAPKGKTRKSTGSNK